MRTDPLSNRGQVLIIFVFAILGLIGITGLAIDGGNIYSDRRHAQNAADTAALAAALARNNAISADSSHARCDGFNTDAHTGAPCSSALITTALNMADDNGYNNDHVGNNVHIYNPPIHGQYSVCGTTAYNCYDYIEVAIDTNVDTFFARVLGIAQTHNTVTAVALSKYAAPGSLYGLNSLVQLKPHSTDCSGSNSGVYFGGSGTITLDGGGVFVNSDNDTCALKITNTCPVVNLLNGAKIVGIGKQTPGCSQPVMSHTSPQLQYPPDPIFSTALMPPAECNQTPAASYTDGSGFTHYYPGHYALLPPDKNTILEDGVFCVDNLVKTTNPTTLKNGYTYSSVNPTDIGGVFIYIKPGGNFQYAGGTVRMNAPSSGPYKGYLMYVDADWADYYAGHPAPDCSINGSADMQFTGVIYAPFCDVSINGGSTPFSISAQLVGFTIALTGNADLTFTYDASKMPITPEKNWTGLFH